MVKSIDAASAKTAQIHEIMRRAVVGLVVQPGRIVIEMLIFDRTDWLRTLLRAAVMQRYPENPIKDIPSLGTAILKTDLKSVFDDQLMWDALEMTGVRKAVRRTPQFEGALDFDTHRPKRMVSDQDFDGLYRLDEAFDDMMTVLSALAWVSKIVNGTKAQLGRLRQLPIVWPNFAEMVPAGRNAIANKLKPRGPYRAIKRHLHRTWSLIRRHIVARCKSFAAGAGDMLDSQMGAT